MRVLFCDDSGGVVKGFVKNVAKPLADSIEAETASSVAGVEVLIEAGEAFDVVVTDLNFEKVGGGPTDGLEVIRLAKEHWPEAQPILMTAYEGALTVRDGQRLMHWGVGDGFLLAKTDAEDPGVTWLRLRERLQGLALSRQSGEEEVKRLKRDHRLLRETVSDDALGWVASTPIPEVAAALRDDADYRELRQVGRSPDMREVFRRIRRAAPLPSDVLVLGPTGTGKELVAQALHDLSPRRDRPFVKADLTTTSGNLVESELFGHEKGAFTGADARRDGLLVAARGGTFFLDEIGNISLEIQAKLLRVLEERKFRPLGSTKDLDADVRFLAATNVDLRRASEEGTFRADLYERMNVMRIVLPPLAARSEDVPLLVALFLDDARKRFGVAGLRRIEREALQLLVDQPWPRNVRQLKHALERLFAEVDPEQEVVTVAALERVLERKDAGGGDAAAAGVTGGTLLRRILAGDLRPTLAEVKKRHGEEVVKDLIRRAMLHFRGLPDDEDCAEYFGGSSANSWRQFAFQHGLTWRRVRDELS
ncbi:MAG: sigma-54-dependent transcriptional regulator [Planctomycetota bacterium JB042]